VDDDEDGITALTVDAAGRVTDVHAGNWTETYAYDAAGNQTHADWPGGALTTGAAGDRTYDGSRLVRAGTVRYEYDAAGRVVLRRRTRLSRKPDVWRYEWDAEDRLTAVTTPDGTRWRYRYDPLGRRIAKQRLAPDGRSVLEETRFTWDSAVLVEETTTSPDLPHPVTLSWWHDDNGLSPVAQTERLTDAVTQEEIDSRFFAIITDLVGTPTELVDEEGATAWRARRTLWGLTEWPVDAPAYTPLRLPGQYYDPESGLHYNLFRYYDPETARYACQDPLGIAPGPNPWAYVSNPYSWIDPFGLSPCPFNVALGIRNRGLREFAERNNFTHYLDSETWENDVWAATRNADVRLHVAIDGFRGGDTPQERFLSAYREGLGDNWYATEREMYHVGEAVRREYRTWDSVTFYENGKPITIEEPTSWPRPGG
jgi:RHS repeat-associated protein